MNINTLLQLVSGKKTYLTAIIIGVLLFGQWQAWWKIDPAVYTALTAAAIAFLRAGVAKGPSNLVSLPPAKPTGESGVAPARLPPLTMLAFACLILTLGAGSLITGCSTTAQQATYQAAGTTAVSVDTAMTLWGTYVANSQPPVSQEQQVASAYADYQTAMAAVCDAGAIYAAANTTNNAAASLALQTAIANASQEIADLEKLIATFGVNLQTTNSISIP